MPLTFTVTVVKGNPIRRSRWERQEEHSTAFKDAKAL
jgi:hypothetical protein